MHHTPIHSEREKFGLVGEGIDWTHDTMDYQTAYEKKIEIFKSIKGSTFVDPDLSLWYIAYLYDQGLSINTVESVTSRLNRVMLDQMDNKFDDNHPAFESLRNELNQNSYEHIG